MSTIYSVSVLGTLLVPLVGKLAFALVVWLVGKWAVGKIVGLLEKSKNLTLLEPVVTLRSALSEDSTAQLQQLAKALCGENCPSGDESFEKKKFVCKICGYVYEGEALPADFVCPICKYGAGDFEEVQ